MSFEESVNINSAVLANGYRISIPWIRSMGFQTHSLKQGNEDHFMSRLALDFLVNSRISRNDPEAENSIDMYLDDGGLVLVGLNGDENPDEEHITLPVGPTLDLSLGHALSSRRSVRNYTGDSIDWSYLATLLRAAGGISAEETIPLKSGGTAKICYRTVPSGGSLYPIDILVAVVNVRGLAKGIYRYSPKLDALFLEFEGKEKIDRLFQSCAMSEEALSCSRSNAIFLLMGHPWKSMRKYGARGLRFMFHEAGGISQNLHLAAKALGLGSVDCASFYENDVHSLLEIDGIQDVFLHSVILGTSS